MLINNTEKVLKEIFGKEKFKELKLYTKSRVIEEFGKQNYLKTKQLISINNSVMLIIGLGKARRYTDNVIEEFLYLDELRKENCLIEPDLEKFKREYSKYINDVERYMNQRKIVK